MIALPPAVRRTGAKSDDGTPRQRLTFKREEADALADVEPGTTVSLPNGERFTAVEQGVDMTGRPTLVVRSEVHPEKETAMPTATAPVKSLATRTVMVPTTHGLPINGGHARVEADVLVLPKPDSRRGGFGVGGEQTALTYTDQAAIDAIAQAEPGAHFTLPDDPGALRIVRRELTSDGRATIFYVSEAGVHLGDTIMRRRQGETNARLRDVNRRHEEAQSERRAEQTRREQELEAEAARFKALSPKQRAQILAAAERRESA